MRLFIIALLLLSSCVSVEKAAPPQVEQPRKLENQNYKWKTQSQIDWTKAAIREHMSDALEMTPKDYKSFCPAWTKLNREERVQALTGLMAAMAVRESGVRGSVKYQEGFKDRKGNWIISRGLFQLSPESANQSAYSCNVKSDGSDLHDDKKNIDCAARILGLWIKRDGVFTGYWSSKYRGGGRYWSVMRNKKKTGSVGARGSSLEYIQKTTRSLKVCSK